MKKHIAPAMEFGFVTEVFSLEIVDARETAAQREEREARQAAKDRLEAEKNQDEIWVCPNAADGKTHFYCGQSGFSGRHLCSCGGEYQRRAG